MLGPWARLALVPQIIPALEGVHAKLGRGARVADIGCGAGVALIAMARAYPQSQFYGFDPSVNAIKKAHSNVAAAGLTNITLHETRAEDVPSGDPFDFVITFDCIHDMTQPADAIAAIRRVVDEDGTWLIKDIRSSPEFRDNLANPMLALHYGFSLVGCMSSGLSEPGKGCAGPPALPGSWSTISTIRPTSTTRSTRKVRAPFAGTGSGRRRILKDIWPECPICPKGP